jgi:hypothetical protein
MRNTRRRPDYADTLIPSRQLIHEVSTDKAFVKARDAFERAIQKVPDWDKVDPHHVRLNMVMVDAPRQDVLRWPRGLPSEVIYNMVAAGGKERAIEAIYFVASILEDNSSYFVFDTKRKIHDNTPQGMIARACGMCKFLATPNGRFIRKYAGRSYLERY